MSFFFDFAFGRPAPPAAEACARGAQPITAFRSSFGLLRAQEALSRTTAAVPEGAWAGGAGRAACVAASGKSRVKRPDPPAAPFSMHPASFAASPSARALVCRRRLWAPQLAARRCVRRLRAHQWPPSRARLRARPAPIASARAYVAAYCLAFVRACALPRRRQKLGTVGGAVHGGWLRAAPDTLWRRRERPSTRRRLRC
jgi:hypothetical protein